MPFHAESVRSSDECVATVVRAIKRYQKMGLCSECIITLIAHDYSMRRAVVGRVWLNNLDQCPVEDAKD